jgi:hypothetical protein
MNRISGTAQLRKTLFIEPGSPWEIGYIESFNGKLRDELLDGEIFDTLLEARRSRDSRATSVLVAKAPGNL